MRFFDEDDKELTATEYCKRYYPKGGAPARYLQEVEREKREALDQAEANKKAEAANEAAVNEGGEGE